MPVFDKDLKWPILGELKRLGADRSSFFTSPVNDECLWIFWEYKVEVLYCTYANRNGYSLEFKNHTDGEKVTLEIISHEDGSYIVASDQVNLPWTEIPSKPEAIIFLKDFIQARLKKD